MDYDNYFVVAITFTYMKKYTIKKCSKVFDAFYEYIYYVCGCMKRFEILVKFERNVKSMCFTELDWKINC